LSASEKHDIAVEILRRSAIGDGGDVSNEELTALALDRFIELDRQPGKAALQTASRPVRTRVGGNRRSKI
jgi:hypothetical protein